MQQIWTGKYRPVNFQDIRGHELITDRVKAMTKQKNFPNLLFAGPAGIGKSTTALVIAKELFGNSWKDSFLGQNASVGGVSDPQADMLRIHPELTQTPLRPSQAGGRVLLHIPPAGSLHQRW